MSPLPEVPGYEVTRKLGAGGMGTVYLARQTSLDRRVALKWIRQTSGADAQAEARFRREALVLSRLDHPGIVQVYDLVRVGPDLCIVMEYVDGVDLTRALRAAPASTGQSLRVVARIADALDHAHGKGILHRDVKPGNVLMSRSGECKLGDFGIAKLLWEGGSFQTLQGVVLGTAAYMAPEQARAGSAVDSRADVYSLAVLADDLLFGALSGRRPSEAAETVTRLAEVQRLLRRARDVDPRHRPASAGELSRRLEAAADRDWPAWREAASIPLVPPTADQPPTAELRPASTVLVSSGAQGTPDPDRTAPLVEPEAASPAGDRSPPPPGAPGGARSGRRPKRPRRLPSWMGTALVAVAIVVVAVAAFQAGTRSAATGPNPAPLAVTGVSVTVDPPDRVGRCPKTTFLFRGRVATNGSGGTVRYQWIKPDGQASDPLPIPVSANARSADVTLQFTYQGPTTAPLGGSATLHVLEPADVYSAPVAVTYRC